MAAPNGSLSGTPFSAGRVVKLNPVDKSITEIGPDVSGFPCDWLKGAMSDSGIIYCPPLDSNRGCILKIDTNTDTTIVLDRNLLPE